VYIVQIKCFYVIAIQLLNSKLAYLMYLLFFQNIKKHNNFEKTKMIN